MEMNREKFIQRLMELNKYEESFCTCVYEIIEKHHLVGRKNKEKIIDDFINQLGLDQKNANTLYNDSMSIIMSQLF